jgi:Sec-independent protein secretion pathway component TatC
VLLAIPMWLLFETGILFARIFKLDQPDSIADDFTETDE